MIKSIEMKYKVGDKVRIKSTDWYNDNKDEDGDVHCSVNTLFVASNKKYLGTIQTIEHVYECKGRYTNNYIYHMTKIDNVDWTDEMIEGLMEEEVDLIPKFGEYSDNEPLDVLTMTTDFVKEHGLPCPDGYEFRDENGSVINAQKIVLEKKKPKYPKTYEECCEILQYNKYLKVYPPFNADIPNYDALHLFDLLETFRKLLICRDTYWKIAGEEMGLGKSWEPDYDSGVNKYGIICMNGVVQKSNPTTNWERHLNKVLDFPTEEMRDAFKENFGPDIEICKEFL